MTNKIPRASDDGETAMVCGKPYGNEKRSMTHKIGSRNRPIRPKNAQQAVTRKMKKPKPGSDFTAEELKQWKIRMLIASVIFLLALLPYILTGLRIISSK